LNVSVQAVSKWLKKLTIDEEDNFVYTGIPKDKADMIIQILKNGKVGPETSDTKIAQCG
jgi:hypothetical protein